MRFSKFSEVFLIQIRKIHFEVNPRQKKIGKRIPKYLLKGKNGSPGQAEKKHRRLEKKNSSDTTLSSKTLMH
jgi:hypothetical protein